MSEAVFGGGCFWCTEAVFSVLKGVMSVEPGYAGGTVENPTYEQVSSGTTGHVETVRVAYDPKRISYRNLLLVFFASHDPTQLNRQGSDVGEQYRSVVFYTTEGQKEEAEAMIREMNESSSSGNLTVTSVEPLTAYFKAEDYHRKYYGQNKHLPYCQLVINPKLEKIQKEFAHLLSSESGQK